MRAALLSVLEPLVVGPSPCRVQFSGGCDSSLLLALATSIARRAGVDDPLPITYRYRDAPGTDETAHQETMIRHLGLDEWLIVDVSEQADLLGDTATRALARHGPLWPPTVLTYDDVFRSIGPGVLISGEGGDEVFGPSRITPVVNLLREVRWRRSPRPWIAPVLDSIAVAGPRRSRLRRGIETGYRPDWIRHGERERLVDAAVRTLAAEPWSLGRALELHLRQPRVWIASRNIRAVAAVHGVDFRMPLLEPEFLGALAAIPLSQRRGRTALLERYFADDLPASIRGRSTKARFTSAFFGPRSRHFAAAWSGDGLPASVDARWLKDHWVQADEPHMGTAMLLHQAWLAQAEA